MKYAKIVKNLVVSVSERCACFYLGTPLIFVFLHKLDGFFPVIFVVREASLLQLFYVHPKND